MILSRTKTYFLLLTVFVVLSLLYQCVWLISSTTEGEIIDFRNGSGRYRHIQNIRVAYSVGYMEYESYYLRSGIPFTDSTIRIKYLLFAPSWSRPDTPIGNWGLILVSFCVYISILTVVFCQKAIIPFGTQFILDTKFPFLWQKK